MVPKLRSPCPGIVSAVLFAALAFASTAHAHEKWFHDATAPPTRWEQAFKSPQIFGITLALFLQSHPINFTKWLHIPVA